MSQNEKPSEMSLLSKSDTNGAELAAAAERLRQTIENAKSGDCSWISRVYDWPFGRGKRKPDYTTDRQAIISAYLAEHATDDGELVSRGWLIAEGFTAAGTTPDDIFLLKSSPLRSESVLLYFNLSKGNCGCFAIEREEGVDLLGGDVTRGEVRRLRALLERRAR